MRRLNDSGPNISRETQGEKSPIARPAGEESGGGDSSNSSSRRIKFSKSPVVKLHKIQTPPSAGVPRVLSQTLRKNTAQEKEQNTNTSEAGATNPPPGDPALPRAWDGDQTLSMDTSSGAGSSSVTHKLRRSPRKNKWVAGRSAGSGSAGGDKQATRNVHTRKKVRVCLYSREILLWCIHSL